ncbi:MAG: DUF4398 domain-containing protein [Bdellovibrionaceae bacterium]|nr:DUF4398 domain-containing protein [Pseudobdellovibrionaceae bacterium]MDW8189820.1 DUF4398 domain-containing protein [Pseudobdellovibrionaceae bacterium]
MSLARPFVQWNLFKRILLVFLASVGFGGCATISAPVAEYNLAFAALGAARKVEAARYASGDFHRAEEACRRGKILFEAKTYGEARLELQKCQYYAEMAETSTRVLRWKKGEHDF